EQMVIRVVQRARDLARQGTDVPANSCLSYFLGRAVSLSEFERDDKILNRFVELDDYDIWSAIKTWASHPDKVLSYLASSILHRNLLKIVLAPEPFDEDFRLGIRELIEEKFGLLPAEAELLLIAGRLSNSAYNAESQEPIEILTKRGDVVNVMEASDLPNIRALSKRVEKFYICYPKEIV
ncbi:MAG TPA: phosphohydrolase, partial [Hymenobacter sp.]